MFQVLLMSCVDALQIKCNVLYMCVRACRTRENCMPSRGCNINCYSLRKGVDSSPDVFDLPVCTFSSCPLTGFSEDVDFLEYSSTIYVVSFKNYTRTG
jgi:hypothetical protein